MSARTWSVIGLLTAGFLIGTLAQYHANPTRDITEREAWIVRSLRTAETPVSGCAAREAPAGIRYEAWTDQPCTIAVRGSRKIVVTTDPWPLVPMPPAKPTCLTCPSIQPLGIPYLSWKGMDEVCVIRWPDRYVEVPMWRCAAEDSPVPRPFADDDGDGWYNIEEWVNGTYVPLRAALEAEE